MSEGKKQTAVAQDMCNRIEEVIQMQRVLSFAITGMEGCEMDDVTSLGLHRIIYITSDLLAPVSDYFTAMKKEGAA
jgi:hypothetical protein